MPKTTSDDPSVVAYRVGHLEATVTKGFEEVHTKLDDMVLGFVSTTQFENAMHDIMGRLTAHSNRITSLETTNIEVGGAIKFLKVAGAVATTLGIIIGALWWTRK